MSNPAIIHEDQPFYVTKERVGKGEYYRVYQNTGTHAVVVASIGVNMSESWNRVLKAISDRKGKENPLVETGKLPLYDSLQEVTAAYPSFRIIGTKTSALEAARRSPTPSHVAGWKQPRNSEGESGSLVVWGYAPGEYGDMDTRKTNPMEGVSLDEPSSRLLKQAMKVGVVTNENRDSVFLVQEAITRLDNGKYRPAHLAEAIQYAQGSPDGDPIANLRDHLSQGYGINTITGERESLAYRGGNGYEDAIAKRARSILETLSYMEKSNPKFKSVRDYKIEKLADRIKQLSHEIGYPLSQDRAELVAEIYVQDTPLNLEDVEKVPNEHLDWRIKERYEEDSNLRKWTEEDKERRRAAGYRVENPSYRPSQGMEHEVNLTDKETGVKYRALVKVSWNKKYYSIDNGDSWFSSTREMKQKQPDWYAVAIKLADPTITGEIRLPSGGSVNKIKNPAQRFRDHYALGKAAAAKLPKNMREYPSSWEYKWKNKGREYEEKLDKQGYKPGIAEYPFNEFMEGLRDALYEGATGAKQFAVYGFRESGNYRNEMPVSPMVFDSASKARRWKQENLTEDEIYRGGPEGRGFVVREYYGQDIDRQHIARLDEQGRLSSLGSTDGNYEEPEMRKSNPRGDSRFTRYRMIYSDSEIRNMTPERLVVQGSPTVLGNWPLTRVYADNFKSSSDAHKAQNHIYKIWMEEKRKSNPNVEIGELLAAITGSNYPAVQRQLIAVVKNLDNKKAKGVYNSERAIAAFRLVAVSAGSAYAKDAGVRPRDLFKGSDYQEAAKRLRDDYENGDLNWLQGSKSNPQGSTKWFKNRSEALKYANDLKNDWENVEVVESHDSYVVVYGCPKNEKLREFHKKLGIDGCSKSNPRWSTRETSEFLDAAAKRYIDSGDWDAISTANQIRYGFHKYVLNEMGTADKLGMPKARAMKLFGQECRRLIRQLFSRPKPNPSSIPSGLYGLMVKGKNGILVSILNPNAPKAKVKKVIQEYLPNWSKEDHLYKAKEYRDEASRIMRMWGEMQEKAHMKTFGTKPTASDYQISGTGRSEYSEEDKDILRTIMRGAQWYKDAARVHEIGAGIKRPQSKSNPKERYNVYSAFGGKLINSTPFSTFRDAYDRAQREANRTGELMHVWSDTGGHFGKGIKLENVYPKQGTFRGSKSNPTPLDVSSLSLDEAYEELDKIRRWIVNDGSKYEGLDREQRSRRIGQLVQSGIKKDMEALAAKYPELKEVWGQYNNTPTAESAISQLFTLGADQYDFISPTRREANPRVESNPSLAPALSSLSSLDPSADLDNDSYHAASAVSEMFHGRPVKEDVTVMEQVFEHDNYAQLGTLHKLIFLAEPKSSRARTVSEVTLQFPDPDAAVSDVVRLCADPEGRTLYFIGGDQSVDLDELGFTSPRRIKDLIVLGTLVQIEYFSDKAFDKFQTINYYHQLGEETKKFPILLYDTHNSTLKLAGGDYSIEDRGIVN